MKRVACVCNFLMENGEKCGAFSLKDDPKGLCFFHSELTKEQRALSSKKGGLVRREDRDIDIKSAFDVTALLNFVVRELKSGRLDSKTANSLIYASNMHLKALEIHQIQEKLEEIHKQMEQNQKYGWNTIPDIECLDVPLTHPKEGKDDFEG